MQNPDVGYIFSICEIHEKFKNIWATRNIYAFKPCNFKSFNKVISLIDVRSLFHKFVFNLRELYLSSLRKIINNFILLYYINSL